MSAITTLVSVTTVGTCNAPCSGVMHDEPIFPGLYPPEIAPTICPLRKTGAPESPTVAHTWLSWIFSLFIIVIPEVVPVATPRLHTTSPGFTAPPTPWAVTPLSDSVTSASDPNPMPENSSSAFFDTPVPVGPTGHESAEAPYPHTDAP